MSALTVSVARCGAVTVDLLRRLLGVKTADGEKQGKVQKLAKGEILLSLIHI